MEENRERRESCAAFRVIIHSSLSDRTQGYAKVSRALLEGTEVGHCYAEGSHIVTSILSQTCPFLTCIIC